MNEVATIQQTQSLQIFSEADINLIKETVCRGATDTELKLFLYQAGKTGLNPLARQVYAVKRWDSSLRREAMSIQVSIDGFRLIAERTGKYAGQTPPQWCAEDGVWKDVWLADAPPAAARVGVLRHDFTEPCYGVARFKAYAQTTKEGNLTMMWRKMGDVMISKCAESLALRKAFPQELSGLYTSDEMAQAQEVAEKDDVPHPSTDDALSSLVEDAKKYVVEIDLADTKEKYDAMVTAHEAQMSKLFEKLPRWHARLVEILDSKLNSFDSPQTTPQEDSKCPA